MKPLTRLGRRCREKGVAAVEMAGFLMVALPLLTAPLFLAIYFWHYTAVQKAAQNSARFLANVPVREMNAATLAGYAETITRQIVDDGTLDLLRGTQYIVDVDCDMSTDPDSQEWVTCGDGAPSQVRVMIRMRLFDDVFSSMDTGDRGLQVKAESRMRYVGN
jgi:Flp pilus assembly protein TadG